MSFEMFFVMVLPLVLYVLVELKYGMKAGVLAAAGASLFLFVYALIVWDDLDPMLLTEVVLIVVLGAISYRLNSSRFFKMQPTVVGVIFAAYIAYFQWLGTPVLVRMLPMVEKLNPEAYNVMSQPNGVEYLSVLSAHSGWLFLVHGIFVGFIGWRFSSVYWIVARLAIYPLAFALTAIDAILYFRA